MIFTASKDAHGEAMTKKSNGVRVMISESNQRTIILAAVIIGNIAFIVGALWLLAIYPFYGSLVICGYVLGKVDNWMRHWNRRTDELNLELDALNARMAARLARSNSPEHGPASSEAQTGGPLGAPSHSEGPA